MLVQSCHLKRCVPRPAVVAAALFVLVPLAGRVSAAQGVAQSVGGNRFASFAKVDAYADASPRSAEQSVPALAAYLARSGPDDLTRTRALYRWVTRHIAYDVPGFMSGNYGDMTPDGVLRRRVSVCEGYSRLTQVVGAAMGLDVAMIKGWSKGYSYNSGEKVDGAVNHSWNAVRIDSRSLIPSLP